MKNILMLILVLSICLQAYADSEEAIVTGFRQTLLQSIDQRRISDYDPIVQVIEEDEVIITTHCSAALREYPVFFEESGVAFNQEMLTGMMLYEINYADECEGYQSEWYCSDYDISSTRAFVGIDSNGNEMSIGFVCKLYNDLPDQRYYDDEIFEYHDCAQVEVDEDGESFVVYPHDY